MAERIAYLLIPAYCSPPTTNRTGEVRLDEMGPCLGKAGLVLMAVLASSSAALAAGDPRPARRCSPAIAQSATRHRPA
jgi:hypothetical protein